VESVEEHKRFGLDCDLVNMLRLVES
jgi:hypothetical protein